MRRGTTPTLTFTTPYDADQVQDGYITITNYGQVVTLTGIQLAATMRS